MKYHSPVLLSESVDGLSVKPKGVYVDLTFGGGGHSRAILDLLDNDGRLFGVDMDADAEANAFGDNRFQLLKTNYRYFANFLEYQEILPVDGILADLGISSHHIDVPERGFSYRFDAPLDMRMNQQAEVDAGKVLNTYSKEDLTQMFLEYGELNRLSEEIAKEIVGLRRRKPLETTFDLVEVVKTVMRGKVNNQVLSKVFQAIRIEVNEELDSLKEMLESVPRVLSCGGRVVVITYHSLEDRLVKNFFKYGQFEKENNGEWYEKDWSLKPVNKKVIKPHYKEVEKNKRARSAKLRIAEKIC
jgi:16S rRNA (cytosine1402-N4)-methyltransferase